MRELRPTLRLSTYCTVVKNALAAGETDPRRLAELARGSLRIEEDTLTAALEGRFDASHRCLLDQLLAQLDHGATLIAKCAARTLELATPLELHPIRLQTIAGIGRRSAEVIVSEIGIDMTRFASAAHLASLGARLSWQPRERGEAAPRRGGPR